MKVEFLRLPHGEGLPLPAYATDGAAAMDICAAEYEEIAPRTIAMIPTGFACAIPDGYEIQCRPRSGLAYKHGITITNSPGTVDSDYRGEIKILLHNLGDEIFFVNKGDRIAQLVLAPVTKAEPVEVTTLSETTRGAGGFGSTGRN